MADRPDEQGQGANNGFQDQLDRLANQISDHVELSESQARLEDGRIAEERAQRQRLAALEAKLASQAEELSMIMSTMVIQAEDRLSDNSDMLKMATHAGLIQSQIEGLAANVTGLHSQVDALQNAVMHSTEALEACHDIIHQIQAKLAEHAEGFARQNLLNTEIHDLLKQALARSLHSNNTDAAPSPNTTTSTPGPSLIQNTAIVAPQYHNADASKPFHGSPAELRNRIWELALPAARVIEVDYAYVDNPGFYEKGGGGLHVPHFWVCKESSDVAKAAFQLCLGPNVPFLTPASASLIQPSDAVRPGVMIQKDRDTIFLTSEAPYAFLEILEASSDALQLPANMPIRRIVVEHLTGTFFGHRYLDSAIFCEYSLAMPHLSFILLADRYVNPSDEVEVVGESNPDIHDAKDWIVERMNVKVMPEALFREYDTAADRDVEKFQLRTILRWACATCHVFDCFSDARCLYKSAGKMAECNNPGCNQLNRVSRELVGRVKATLADRW
ncbi:hypothetical protein PVAG01_09829 [Phlyctema vagabunda]|uniref:2EXR domain-containing protein n=1 Tax=Phlyctema vagabunda TaxID=108571 RepID=A0ABR4P480_9HELO